MPTTKSTLRRNLLIALGLVLLAAGFFGWKPIKAIYFSGVPHDHEKSIICIPTGSNFEKVVSILKKENLITDEQDFRWLAGQMKYIRDSMRAGRFEIEPGWTNRDLIQHLRAGKQSPVKVVLNNERLPEEIAGQVSRFIEADSLSMLRMLTDASYLSSIGYTPETVIAAFIPNTYEMYWNTDPRGFMKRMLKERDNFWDKNGHRERAKALGLTETELYTLASIVERETNANIEKPTIAGVYLNRLRIGMKLQADPTCVFATRDFTTHRVTEYHTGYNSPYNTYMYKGLPPGPISMASIPTLEASLNPEIHNYLYFCAKPDESGTHAFAETFAAHKVNADRFQAWLRTRGR